MLELLLVKWTEVTEPEMQSVSFLVLPVVYSENPPLARRECGQEENADPLFFSLPRLSCLSQGASRRPGCMDALYGAGKSQNNPTFSSNTACHCVRGATKGLALKRKAFCACQAA